MSRGYWYPEEKRRRIAEDFFRLGSGSQAARLHQVSYSTVRRYAAELKRRAEAGTGPAGPETGPESGGAARKETGREPRAAKIKAAADTRGSGDTETPEKAGEKKTAPGGVSGTDNGAPQAGAETPRGGPGETGPAARETGKTQAELRQVLGQILRRAGEDDAVRELDSYQAARAYAILSEFLEETEPAGERRVRVIFGGEGDNSLEPLAR